VIKDKGGKAFYIAPLKSLVKEKYEQWKAQFPRLRWCVQIDTKVTSIIIKIISVTEFN
jgi:replicative superfamily II helicase